LPTSTLTVVPTATAGPTVDETWQHSKYDGVWVYTVEEQANEGRSLLHVAYPVTEHPAINDALEALAEEFIDEFREESSKQEAAYQAYVRETGEPAASFVTHYIQHFDVTLADARLLSLAVERYRSMGGTGSAEVTGHVFDRAAGTELAPADFFVSDDYLGRLAQLAREALEQDLRAELASFESESESAQQEWLASRLAMIQEGTEPRPENYDTLVFYDDSTLHVQFDKYQVAPGYRGVVTVVLPVESVADLLTPAMRSLLETAAPTPTPTAPPPAMATASPTAVAATIGPATPAAGGQPVTVDCAQVLCVALTFDDGPSVHTDGLLDVLRAHGAHATFFLLGQSAQVQRQTVARIAQEGHELGNHSWSHLSFEQLTETQMRDELDPTNALIQEITGTAPLLFRPPYGAWDDAMVASVGMPVILWSLDPLDWRDRDADVVAQRMQEASAGAIILAHDIHPSTVEAIPAVLDALTARGMQFVTVSELMAPTVPESGQVYTARSAH